MRVAGESGGESDREMGGETARASGGESDGHCGQQEGK